MPLEDHLHRQLDPSILARTAEEIADRTIVLGDDASRFLEGEVGKYLIARAKDELAIALLKLATETDRKRIKELQFQVQVIRAVPDWLQDAIDSGRSELEMKLSREGE